jgi:hypothetical protein
MPFPKPLQWVCLDQQLHACLKPAQGRCYQFFPNPCYGDQDIALGGRVSATPLFCDADHTVPQSGSITSVKAMSVCGEGGRIVTVFGSFAEKTSALEIDR